ncbi:unnamed protein product [Paramecium primaurelia]|uniref:Transmembrane protein n=1 Tax=Paramecium primaurelia TaxID=5886 RepID=A0A8S1K4G4_PARPR|nr:unnamed protein product [Paramecium primaurelia]
MQNTIKQRTCKQRSSVHKKVQQINSERRSLNIDMNNYTPKQPQLAEKTIKNINRYSFTDLNEQEKRGLMSTVAIFITISSDFYVQDDDQNLFKTQQIIRYNKFNCKNVFSFGKLSYYYKSTYLEVVIEDFVMIIYLLFNILYDLRLISFINQTQLYIFTQIIQVSIFIIYSTISQFNPRIYIIIQITSQHRKLIKLYLIQKTNIVSQVIQLKQDCNISELMFAQHNLNYFYESKTISQIKELNRTFKFQQIIQLKKLRSISIRLLIIDLNVKLKSKIERGGVYLLYKDNVQTRG